MMTRRIGNTIAVLAVLLVGTTVQAELKLVENFDNLTGGPDGVACTGVLGGTWDTQSEGTGNVVIEDNSGSRVVRFMSQSAGDRRGVGFNGVTNPIDDGETGMAFFRFMLRSDSQSPRTYIGLISDTSDDPITTTNVNTPSNIPAGFGLVNDNAGGFNLVKTDGTTVLKAGLKRTIWYNTWIIADNAADTFDLYLSEATGPAGAATLPKPEDMVASAIPFNAAITTPLNGMVFACPTATVQSTRTYIDEIWWDGDQGLSKPTKARNPSPAQGESDVPGDVVLSWKPGASAAKHDVYFGTNEADVGSATLTSPVGGVSVSAGQDANSYDPPGLLQFGQMCYWRVDEVNAPPDSEVFTGDVWSFRVEPYAYRLTNVTATASSSFNADSEPNKTVDGSGLTELDDANDTVVHGSVDDTMWLSQRDAPAPAWILYEFDQVYKLDRMLVWNYNSDLEVLLNAGVKDVLVEYSIDAQDWQTLPDVQPFTQGPSAANYASDIVVDFGGAAAKYVRLNPQSNWAGDAAQFGLSEVRFYYVPVRARQPQPDTQSTGVNPEVVLSWRAGREAASHQVYLSTDSNAVANGTALVDTVQENRYTADTLDLGKTYYWKVVEVSQVAGAPTWESDIWSFSTVQYLLVDDMESYENVEPMEIWATWLDGTEYGTNDPTNGSIVGVDPQGGDYNAAPGRLEGQSLPIWYNNTTASRSEVSRTFSSPWNWARHGIKGLSLYFYGDPDNSGQMYLKINNSKVLYDGNAEDLKRTQWQPWNVDLVATGINLQSVTKLTIGIDGAGASGRLYFDDIRLVPSVGEKITPVDPGTTGMVAWYKFDGDLKDSVGTNHATARGNALVAGDPIRGQVLSLDGVASAADVPLLGSGSTLTIAMWVNTVVDPVPIQYTSFFHCDGWEAADLHWRYTYGKVESGVNGIAGGGILGQGIAKPNQWNHVAVTVSATEWAVWLNGLKEASRALTVPATVTLGDGLIGAWLGTDGITITRAFTGQIDDARFYNRALSQEEIASLAGRIAPFHKPIE